MISEFHVKQYCKDDLSLIENYDKAIADTTQIWHCHHRLEIQGDKVISTITLKEKGLYYNRPAFELVFLTPLEHNVLHGNNMSEEHKQKNSMANSGKNNAMFGKKQTLEAKQKISMANKGRKTWLGKHHSEETKRKISESKKGHIPWNKGKKKQNKIQETE